MKIAVINKNGNVTGQFGNHINFTIYEGRKGKPGGQLILNATDNGGGDALLFILKNEGAQVLLCEQISKRLKEELERCGIEVVEGLKGKVKSILRVYLTGRRGRLGN